MTAQLAIDLSGLTPSVADRQRAALATLPRTCRESNPDEADVVAIDGSTDRWIDAAEAAVRMGKPGLLITSPPRATAEELERFRLRAEQSGVVVLVECLRHDPAWGMHAEQITRALRRAELIQVNAVIPTGPGALAGVSDQLMLLQTAAPAWVYEAGGRTDGAYWGVGHTGAGTEVAIGGVIADSARPSVTFDLLGPEEQWKVSFDNSALSAPTTITRYDSDGATEMPAIHETARRQVWRTLAHTPRTGGPQTQDLRDLSAVLATAAALTPPSS